MAHNKKKTTTNNNSSFGWGQITSLLWGKPNQKSAGSTQRKKTQAFKASGKPSLADQMGLGNRYKK